MTSESSQMQVEFKANKVRVIENAYLYFFAINIIDSIISRSRTVYDIGHESNILFGTFVLFILSMGLILISKYFIK